MTNTLHPSDGKWTQDKYGDVIGPDGRTVRVCGFALTGSADAKAATQHIVRAVNSHADLLEALESALEFVEDYEDVDDGPDGRPVANKAMSLASQLREAIAKAQP